MDIKRVVALAVLLVLFLDGCRGGVGAAGPSPAAPPSSPTVPARATAPSAAPSSSPVAARPTATPAARISAACRAPGGQRQGLLTEIRAEQHADHDRILFQFDGRRAPSARITYVDRVTADPSDQPVPLLGKAFVNVAFQGARLDTAPIEEDPTQARRYTGPTRLTPRYNLLQELAVSGDFEAVLSVGLGLSRVAGLSVSIPNGGGCVILDVWRGAPNVLLWPMTSVVQARAAQQATIDGHQPWMLSAEQVATSYIHRVMGWPQARIDRLDEHVFQATVGAQVAVITLTQPLGRAGTVWAVASVIRSNT